MSELLGFILRDVVPGLNHGLVKSLTLIVPASLLGAALGAATGVARVYGPWWLMRLADAYVALFRGTPLVVQLFFWYFALPQVKVLGLRLILSPEQAAILGFALCSAAYQSEYVRGGLMSVRQGQLKAALALGMGRLTAVRAVVLPQAFRHALPGCGNEIIYLIKYSSLASIITVNELTGVGRGIAKATWQNTEVYCVVGLYYLALVTAAALLLRRLERRLAYPGLMTAGGEGKGAGA